MFPSLAFVDLETTGATAAADRITEVGIVTVDEGGVSEWSSLVNPQTPISAFIERLTGISDAMVAGAPTFAELADEIRARLAGRLFIAHNARFDYGFLRHEFQRLGSDFRATVLCTVKLSRKLEPQHHRHNLDSLIARHGLVADGRHRALADARLIHQLWARLHERHPAATIAAAVGELSARPQLPPQIDAAAVEDLPEGHGVFVFYGDDDVPLYVGSSRHVRKSVLAHFAGGQGKAGGVELAQQLRRIEAIETAGEVGAALQELALIRRFRLRHNRLPDADEEICSWQLAAGDAGHWRPVLVLAEDIDLASPDGAYGLFRNPREAQRALRRIAREHELCLALLGLEAAGQGCSAQRLGQCRGACVGREAPSLHGARLLAGLARMRLARWPFAGPALLAEGDTVHVIDRWCHLGSARSETDVWALVDDTPAGFDAAVYRLLVRRRDRLAPLSSVRAPQPVAAGS